MNLVFCMFLVQRVTASAAGWEVTTQRELHNGAAIVDLICAEYAPLRTPWLYAVTLFSWFVHTSVAHWCTMLGRGSRRNSNQLLTRFNKIATQGAPQMAVDKEANSLSRVYSYYSKFNLRLFYV